MLTRRIVFPLIALVILTSLYSAFGGDGQNDDLSLETIPGRYPPYALGDTIVIGVKATIPRGYHLYSNPLGPGIGKPLNLFINRRDADNGSRAPWNVVWLEARKSFPKRYNPPIGSWVWAYESEAYFFVKGVMKRDNAAAAVDTAGIGNGINTPNKDKSVAANAKAKPAPAKDRETVKNKLFGGLKGKKGVPDIVKADAPPPPRVLAYEAIVEALMCKTACVPILKSIHFELPAPTDTVTEKPTSTPPNPRDSTEKSVERASTPLSPPATAEKVIERSRTCLSRRKANGLTPDGGIAFPSAPAWQTHYAKSEPIAFSVGMPSSLASALNGANSEQGGLSGLPPIPPQSGLSIDLSGLSNPSDSVAESQARQRNNNNDAADRRDISRPYDYTPLEERREYSLLTAILFALLAGLALNLTPCIFPMLSVRVLSFAESARESRRSAVVRSAAFSLGIVAVFLLLAGLAAFAGFSWGQQFQNPGMMVGIIAIVFLFALGMFNFYTLSVPALGSGGGSGEGKGGGSAFAGDFLKGAAATVMATPCGGPFLGALLAWALLQKPFTIFILFATMGVGMALPYVLLASSRRLMSLLPKPGRWIEDLKHFMGFLLLAFAVNMMRGLDPRLTVAAVGICLSILIAASVNRRFSRFGMPAAKRAVTALVSLALLTVGIIVSVVYLRIDVQIFNDDQPGVGGPYWSSFSQQALATAHEERRNVIVNFTASWCTNCKLNKAAALNTAAARQLYGEKNILLLTADITNDNPEAQELMRHLGSRSVPFLAIFPGDAHKNPVIMRDILSKEKFLGELRNLP
ncbi:MAG: thioredoxin family protein [Chitinispirillales bacterium]|jgi:thiol:disulfide interchange protein|nr:thioredoxin family protein [Chitinispirillales bacterium]